MCWGSNSAGQLGNGMTTNSANPLPVTVMNLTNAVQIAAGENFTCARRSDATATVACWGANGSGQLGTGNTMASSVPVAVPGLNNVVEIAAGGRTACARRNNGNVFCWGRNTNGQIGNGMTGGTTSTPAQVSGLTTAEELAVGTSHACARRTDGTVVCWGLNSSGQLGDNSIIQRPTPVVVSGLTAAAGIAAGGAHSCAHLSTAETKCWGLDANGQLGDNLILPRLTPTVTQLTCP